MAGKLQALVINCSLKASPKESSADVLANQLIEQFAEYDVDSRTIRLADYAVAPGVELDMGEGDDWPAIRQQMLASDILILATPIWVGHPSSLAQRVIERLDAELSESDEQGRLLTYGKVAAVAVVGNEDGAHKVCADMFQALNDVGFTIAAGGATYWVGEAMQTKDYKDLSEIPDKIASTNASLACNTAHLARLLQQTPYPAPAT